MSTSELHSMKNNDHLIIFLDPITKGQQGGDHRVVWRKNKNFETGFTKKREAVG
jgi:hypothetical protein